MTAVGIGLFQYVGRASRTATESNLQSVKMALQSFYADTGTYPATLAELLVKPARRKSCTDDGAGHILIIMKNQWMAGKHPFVYQLSQKVAEHDHLNSILGVEW